MASTSSVPQQWKYDVFISFRGADTRDGFLSHLFDALCRNQIITFKDENLDRGVEISNNLLQIIEESYFAVVIFSENYANSSWCLDELVKIIECNKLMGQQILPVFYQIDPTDVQELTGSYGDAFIKHREEFKDDLDKVENWSRALKETAGMSGLVSQNLKPESKLIEEIVNHILKKLNETFPNDPCDDGLVGIKPRIKDLESLLHLEAMDVRFIGIWGMGGIGKTTLASKIFDQLSSQFDGRCFIYNVREKLEKYTSDGLQHEILSQISGKQNSNVCMPIMLSSSIKKIFIRKKVFIVLDDVSDLGALGFLIGDNAIYAQGSRIILTSRDKQILKNRCVDIYEVQELNYIEAIQLFRIHAFKQNHPIEALMKMANRAILYTKGVPLALQVLGSSLYNKNAVEWEDQLKKLEDSPDKTIQNTLRVSYDGLDENEKEIFLDIACFFTSEDKDHVESALECLGHFARIGISCLLDKCLIFISKNKIEMHDLLQQMGKDIVINECHKNPRKRSRLWNPQEIINVLTKDLGTISTESISLDMSKIQDIELSSGAFERMNKLKFLKLYCPYYEEDLSSYQQNKIFDPHKRNYVSLSEELSFLPNDLRYLYWYKYPSKSLPMNFFPENLVHLHLMHSHIQQLYNKNQCLLNLRFLDLSYSVDLLKMPDLSKFLKLESLRLKGCESLVEIFSSNQPDSKLSHIDLGHCKRLESIPSFLHLKNLNFLSLEGCSNINEFPKVPRNIGHLILDRIAVVKVPSSIRRHNSLTKLSLYECTRIKFLPNGITELKCLVDLNLSGCSELVSLPDNIGELKRLKDLELSNCSKLMNLPEGIGNLKSLMFLDISLCQNLKELPENLGALESLKWLCATKSGIKRIPSSINCLSKLDRLKCDECEGLVLPSFTGLSSLKHISLENCGMIEIPSSMSSLVSLRELNLNGNNLEMLPTSFKNLPKLEKLSLSNCKRLKCLSDLPSALQSLVLSNCTMLKVLPSSLTKGNMDSLWFLDTRNCANLDQNECKMTVDYMILRLESCLPQLKLYAFGNSLYDTFQEMVQQNVKICTFLRGLHIGGGEIPPKLMYLNNNGSSLLLPLRSGPHDFMVLAFWAFVAVKDTPSEDCDSDNEIYVKCECRFMDDSGQILCFETVYRERIFKSLLHDEVFGSEHTFLWYSTVQFTHSKYSFSTFSFEFYTKIYCDGREHLSSTAVVSKCGIHILFDDNNIGPLTHEDNIAPLNVPSAWRFYKDGQHRIEIKEHDEDEDEGQSSSEDDEEEEQNSNQDDEEEGHSHPKRTLISSLFTNFLYGLCSICYPSQTVRDSI
ncbi:disease resistance protein RPV1-like [Mercurialis annua]|uniref:disease resistance protein RPV1-like n=1 Tax=Mercurialis annua TaxID=3986 RepID=UPI0024AFAF10|nr:disease resistance protein RPV1-like [Mercurialis annua]